MANVVPFAVVSPRGLLPLPKWPGEIIAFSRPLLGRHVWDRVSSLPGVHTMANTGVMKLLSTQDRTRVIGVQTRKQTEEGHAITTLQADLVVDASGRHSQAPQWLMELGYKAPPIETINSNLRYASRFYAKPDKEWQSLFVNGRHPHGHAGFILSVDHER